VRIVVLSSSVYSETACAVCARLAHNGYVPVGALVLRSLNRKTILRKVSQWGFHGAAGYVRSKVVPGKTSARVRNSYLRPFLENGGRGFRSLCDVAAVRDFPIVICMNQNSPTSVARLKQWSPDIIVFAGGNILRRPLLRVPRLGVLNAHLGLLPEIRGMSSPEWSVLNNVPAGVTIHFIDEGIDTGPVLQRYELPDPCGPSLSDLRDRLIALGVEKMAEVVGALDRGTMSAKPQVDLEKDNQFFVMHERLQAIAAQRLASMSVHAVAGVVHG
jgi:methionyl-tRNA formyltransferase